MLEKHTLVGFCISVKEAEQIFFSSHNRYKVGQIIRMRKPGAPFALIVNQQHPLHGGLELENLGVHATLRKNE